MEHDQLPSHRTSWRKPHLTWKLLLILAFLGIHAVSNVLAAFMQLLTSNLQNTLIFIITAALYILPAYGLYNRKKWARLMQMILSLIFVIQGIVMMVNGVMFMGMINVVSYGLIAIYLLGDECRTQFKTPAA